MRRTLALVLLLVFGLPVVSPALGLTADADANLPACCRRNGAHHCHMSMAERDALTHGTQLRVLRMHCPSYPAVPTTTGYLHLFVPVSASQPSAAYVAETGLPQTEARARVARSRAHHKRGPPTLLG